MLHSCSHHFSSFVLFVMFFSSNSYFCFSSIWVVISFSIWNSTWPNESEISWIIYFLLSTVLNVSCGLGNIWATVSVWINFGAGSGSISSCWRFLAYPRNFFIYVCIEVISCFTSSGWVAATPAAFAPLAQGAAFSEA